MHAAYDNSIRNNCVDTYALKARFYGYTDKKISLKGLFCALLRITHIHPPQIKLKISMLSPQLFGTKSQMIYI
jgi:hypothetical protein